MLLIPSFCPLSPLTVSFFTILKVTEVRVSVSVPDLLYGSKNAHICTLNYIARGGGEVLEGKGLTVEGNLNARDNKDCLSL